MRALVRNKEMEGIPFRLSLRVRDLKEGFNGMILKHQMRLGTPGRFRQWLRHLEHTDSGLH